ncbi:MAG TPA: type II secretion system protein [Candidatus Omnitrophota bacterium]|nr:type II secretion system protein [Candidatus Omnitrophota bacterium]HRZ14749.1 type II secretion system protein [Candidatus Omnitrophota bacterium]
MSKRGFTFLELVITIICIGILVAIAVPQFLSFAREAVRAAEQGSVQGIKAGIRIYGIDSVVKNRSPQFPATLDTAGATYASYSNPLFSSVLKTPITESRWLKIDSTIYQGPTETYYYYVPAAGLFLEYSGSTDVGASTAPSVFLPALAFSGYNTSQWGAANGGLYSPWSGYPLAMSVNFQQGGTYTFDIAAINNANHPGFANPPRTDWHLPTGYNTFNVRVLVDGVPVGGNVNITASDTDINRGSISTYIGAGQHTVSLVWLNDAWTPAENGDANIQFQDIIIRRQ